MFTYLINKQGTYVQYTYAQVTIVFKLIIIVCFSNITEIGKSFF